MDFLLLITFMPEIIFGSATGQIVVGQVKIRSRFVYVEPNIVI